MLAISSILFCCVRSFLTFMVEKRVYYLHFGGTPHRVLYLRLSPFAVRCPSETRLPIWIWQSDGSCSCIQSTSATLLMVPKGNGKATERFSNFLALGHRPTLTGNGPPLAMLVTDIGQLSVAYDLTHDRYRPYPPTFLPTRSSAQRPRPGTSTD